MTLNALALGDYLASVKNDIVGHHLSHPILYSEKSVFFHLSGDFHRFCLILDDGDPRFYCAKEAKEVPSLDSKFLETIKRELSNAYINDVEQLFGDRLVRFSLTVINGVFKEESRFLYFEMIPHHANAILTSSDDKIIVAYRPGTMEDARPLLHALTYFPPERHDSDYVSITSFSSDEYYRQCLEKETFLEQDRKKDRFGFLIQTLKRREKQCEKKMQNIEQDILSAKEHLRDGDIGDYIYTNYGSIDPKARTLVVEGTTVALDPARNLSRNADLFYKRAKKAKQALLLSEENLVKTKEELSDVASALKQLTAADEEGLEALSKELDIHPKTPTPKKKEKDWRGLSRDSLPYFIDYHGTKILFGKSAKQNDCLSFLFDTAKQHYWLHILGNTGSHVMIKKENPSSDEILAAAEICLINSAQQDGEVMVAKRENVRKGSVMGQAIVKEFQTLRVNHVRDDTRKIVLNAQKITF